MGVAVRRPLEGAFARFRRWPTWVWVLGSYLALAILFFWPSFASGAVPLPLMNPYAQDDPAWSAFPPPGMARGANPLLSDVSDFFYPYAVFTINTLRSGHLPLWNPDLFGGMPFFASNQPAMLYPINVICYWLGAYSYWLAAALLRMLIAGGGMYLFARRLGAGRIGAWLSGGIYIFASFNIVWLHFALNNIAALLPLALWLILLLIERPRRWPALGLAAVTGAHMLGGHPETSLSFLMVCAAFTLVWLIGRATWLSSGALITLAVALGIAIATVQWVPTLAMVFNSATTVQRNVLAAQAAEAGSGYSPLGGVRHASWGNLRHWLLLVAPEMWGYPQGELWQSIRSRKIRYWLNDANYNEMSSYVGLITLPLALLGVLRSDQRRTAGFFGALIVVGLSLIYALPGIYRVGYLPVFNVAHGVRMGLWITLGASVLAGLGLTWLMQARRRVVMLTALLLVVLAGVNLAVAYDLWGGVRVTWTLGFVPDTLTRSMISEVFGPSLRPILPAIAGLLAALPLLAAACGWLRASQASTFVAGLAVAELVTFGYGYNGFTSPEAIYPTTQASAWLKAAPGPFRIVNPDGAFAASKVMTQGLQVVTGIDPLEPYDQHWFIDRGMRGLPWIERRVAVLPDGQRLMDLMNVRYIVARQSVVRGRDGPTLTLLLKDGNVRIYDNPTALPRAYAATGVVEAAAGAGTDAAFNPSFDPHRAVVLEETVAGMTSGSSTPVTPVPVISYTPNRVELEPDLAAPAVVVLADGYDPDWRVTVDGQEARMLRANGVFRAVVVPQGRHRVVFSYWPRLVVYGGIVSLLALLGCAVVGVWSRSARA